MCFKRLRALLVVSMSFALAQTTSLRITNHPLVIELIQLTGFDYTGEVYLTRSDSRVTGGDIFISAKQVSSLESFAEVFYHELCHAQGVVSEQDAKRCSKKFLNEAFPKITIDEAISQTFVGKQITYVPWQLKRKFLDIRTLARDLLP